MKEPGTDLVPEPIKQPSSESAYVLRRGTPIWNINKLYHLGDLETWTRTREDLRVQTLATNQYKKLLQRVHKLERKLSRLEHGINGRQNQAFSSYKEEESGKNSICNREGAPYVW